MRGGALDMVDGPALHVLTFRPAEADSAVDDALRGMLPALLAHPGITDAFVARRVEDAGERVLATMWQSPAEASESERLPGLPAASRVERALLRIAIRPEGRDPARILRVFRGEVRSGELDDYVEEVRRGTLEDAISNTGLVGLYLGTTGSATFVTVSAWVEWNAIEAATGGDTRRPMATKNSARLTGMAVDHYEILPSSDRMIDGVVAAAG
jgi:hypothetical protein